MSFYLGSGCRPTTRVAPCTTHTLRTPCRVTSTGLSVTGLHVQNWRPLSSRSRSWRLSVDVSRRRLLRYVRCPGLSLSSPPHWGPPPSLHTKPSLDSVFFSVTSARDSPLVLRRPLCPRPWCLDAGCRGPDGCPCTSDPVVRFMGSPGTKWFVIGSSAV